MKERNDREAQLRASITRLLQRISPANRPFIEDRLNERWTKCKPASQQQWLNVMVQIDEALAGTPFANVTPRELSALVGAWRQRKQDSTLALHTMYLRGLWAIVKGVKRPEDLPPEYARAMDVPEPERRVHGRVLTDQELEAVLQAVIEHDADSQRAFRTPMKIAAIWTLRDVGFRARELLSLNVGDVVFKDTPGPNGRPILSVQLHLRKGAPNLKTGPRSVAGTRCAAPLRAWLALHPRGTDPKAPLFCGIRDDSGLHRWDYKELRKVVIRAGRDAKVSGTAAHPGNLHLHDFRHTAATEKAKTAGWNELMMREHFGWEAGSDMPSHYAKLTFEDLEAQVLRDAGIVKNGQPALSCLSATSTSLDDQAVLAALRRLLIGTTTKAS